MKNYFLFLLIVCCTFFSCKTQKSIQQTVDTSQSLLYKIEKRGIKPSYIFGTIHMMPQSEFEIEPKIVQAFENSELLVLELDMDDPQIAMDILKHTFLPEGQSLEQFFSPEAYKKLGKALQETAGVDIELFKKMKLMFVEQMLMTSLVGENPASFEMELMKMANKAKMDIEGLETASFQMTMLDSVPMEEQAQSIMEMIEDEKQQELMFRQLLDTYKAENPEQLYKMFTEIYEMENDELDIMLHQRNKNWIPKIGEMAKKKSVFFGVGAGHLGGQQGVINLLREAGYTITPILD